MREMLKNVMNKARNVPIKLNCWTKMLILSASQKMTELFSIV